MRPPLPALIAACLLLPVPALANIYTVTNNNDSGAGSLRTAITNANGSAGLDTVRFNIGGGGLWTLAVGPGGLPDVTDPLFLDGWSQPGFSGTPLIQLNGAGASGSTAGINLRTSNCTVRGFIIHSFPDEGIEMDGILAAGDADNNVITGNWVGVDAAGVSRPNADNGILVTENADGNQIGGTGPNDGNIIASSGGDGLLIRLNSNNNLVYGNFIGVLADGVTARGNTRFGIELLTDNDNNFIGGTLATQTNVIAHNTLDGVALSADCSSVLIQNNRIFSNTGIGIDLNDDGVSANDAGDADAGANNRLNFPVIYRATILGAILTVAGEGRPGAVVEFFQADAAAGNGEGQTFVGRGTVSGATPGTVDATARQFTFTFALGTVVVGTPLTGTATDGTNNTSEFGANVPATRFAVTTTSDVLDGTITSLAALVTNPGADGEWSLREAITACNNTAGTDSILFRISAPLVGGVHTITPTSVLPTVSTVIHIDGTTEPDFAGTPVVELNGTSAGAAADGLRLDAGSDGSTVRGLIINRFNRSGVRIDAPGCGIYGNRIGTDQTGTVNRANGLAGVMFNGGNAVNTKVGGVAAGAGNIIAFNGTGVVARPAAGIGNSVVGNSIRSNTGIGIDLRDNGVTPNDAGDVDGGPNEMLNFPVFVSAGVTTGQILAEFDLDAPAAWYRIDFYRNPGGADPTGFGEGQTPAASFVINHAGGTVRYLRSFAGVVGEVLTATTTVCTDGAACAVFGSTSEFDGAFTTVLGPLGIVKRAFLPGGTPITTGTAIPRGTDVEFVLYVNNPGALANDVSMSDLLLPGFAYIGGSLRYSATTPNCPPSGCSPAEEAAIYSSIATGTAGTEGVDGDVVSFGASTVRIGNQDVPNAQLNVPAGRVWALRFRVRMQ